MQHNFTDGMALGSAFLLHGSVGGWSRTLFLLAHELPQEVIILYSLNFQSLLSTFLMYSSFTLCHSLVKFMRISVSGTW
jgi:zinc transporter ZupT